MKVVILCGGLGTRLREETEFRPKPMVPIGGRPILWHIMQIYAHHGHKDFVLCLGYKGEIIRDYFRNFHWNTCDLTMRLDWKRDVNYHTRHEAENWTVTLLDTGAETQTGGRLLRAIRHLERVGEADTEPFLLTYGDGLTDSDINQTIAFHREHGAIATVTAVKPKGRFGELAMDGQTITAFREKPDEEAGYISGGFFVLNRSIARYLTGDPCVLEREPLEVLAQAGQLKAYCHAGFWQCMDTFREQEMLNRLWTTGQAPWKVW